MWLVVFMVLSDWLACGLTELFHDGGSSVPAEAVAVRVAELEPVAVTAPARDVVQAPVHPSALCRAQCVVYAVTHPG